MLRLRRPHVEAITFDRHPLNVVAKSHQLSGERIPDLGFLTRDGLNVNQLACEGERVMYEE